MSIGPIEQQEREISEKVYRKKQEVFGDKEVQVPKGHPHYKLIKEFIKEAAKDFPMVPKIGSRFVNCYCTVRPQLIFTISSLKSILTEDPLLPSETGEKICFGPLKHFACGSITTEDTTLEIRNVRKLDNTPLKRNVFTEEERRQMHRPTDRVVLDNEEIIRAGEIDDNPELLRDKRIAHVTFGNLLKDQEMVIDVETTGDYTSTKYIISLPAYKGKIRFDGSITLKNGTTFKIHEAIGTKAVTWVNFPCTIEVPFEP